MTRTIFSAPGYRGLETYLGIFAKSNVVHVSVTTVSILPASGSKTINTSATPLWTYTESTFSGCPGSQGIRISFISCFVRFVYADNRIGGYMDAGKTPAHPPALLQIQHPLLGCTIPLQAMA